MAVILGSAGCAGAARAPQQLVAEECFSWHSSVEFRPALRPEADSLLAGSGRLVIRTERLSRAPIDSTEVRMAGMPPVIQSGGIVRFDSLAAGVVQFLIAPARRIPLQVGVVVREGYTDTVVVRPTVPDAVIPCDLR